MEREEIFRTRLRNLRTGKQLTQQKAADGIGMTKVGYQNYEAGRQMPNFALLPRIAKFYNVSLDYLFGLSDEPHPPKFDEKTLDLLRAMEARFSPPQVPAQ